MLSEVFWVSFVSALTASFALTLRMCLRSRCDRVDCLCIKIHRAVDLESMEAQHQPQLSSPTVDQNDKSTYTL